MKLSNRIILLLLGAIIIGALGLRLIHLGTIPPGLNRDETAIGYTSYSLIQTAKDEYGKLWPLSFKSFGDWKVPVYFYLLLPFIQLLGLTETVVRLPSALLGTATVFLTFFLMRELLILTLKDLRVYTKSDLLNFFENHIPVVSLIAAASLAITPWHVFMSRNASESNVAVFLVTLSLWTFFLSLRRLPKLIIVSFLGLALTMYTYHGNHIFTPLLVGGLCAIYWHECKRNKWFTFASVLFLSAAFLIFSQTLLGADKTKISGLFPLGDEAKLHAEIELRRLEYPENSFVAKVIHNKLFYLAKTVINNYVKGFSAEFLFISGGTNAQHNIPNFGNLFIWQAPFLLLAVCVLLVAKNKNANFLLFWLLISPVAASITRDAPHTNRMMGILPLPALLTAIGIMVVVSWGYHKKFWIPVVGSIIVVATFYFVLYLDQYFIHFPLVAAKNWGYGYRELVTKVTKLQNRYPEIVIARPDYSPYIYFLFFQKFDPAIFQQTVVRYPETAEGFHHVEKLGNLHFQKIGWSEELMVPNRLYIDWAEGVPSGATNSGVLITKDELARLEQSGFDSSDVKIGDYITSRLIDQVNLPDGSTLFYLISTYNGTPSAQLTL